MFPFYDSLLAILYICIIFNRRFPISFFKVFLIHETLISLKSYINDCLIAKHSVSIKLMINILCVYIWVFTPEFFSELSTIDLCTKDEFAKIFLTYSDENHFVETNILDRFFFHTSMYI